MASIATGLTTRLDPTYRPGRLAVEEPTEIGHFGIDAGGNRPLHMVIRERCHGDGEPSPAYLRPPGGDGLPVANHGRQHVPAAGPDPAPVPGRNRVVTTGVAEQIRIEMREQPDR